MAELAPAAPASLTGAGLAPAKALKKKSSPRGKKEGGSLSKLIVSAVGDATEKKGISMAALKKVLAGKGVDVGRSNKRINTAVSRLVSTGILSQTKGVGAAGSYKVAKKVKRVARPGKKLVKKKSPVKAKKPTTSAKKPKTSSRKPVAPKKAAVKKSPRKTPLKKATTKKPAARKSPKKSATKKPKAAARRPAGKKTASRRPAAKKSRR